MLYIYIYKSFTDWSKFFQRDGRHLEGGQHFTHSEGGINNKHFGKKEYEVLWIVWGGPEL